MEPEEETEGGRVADGVMEAEAGMDDDGEKEGERELDTEGGSVADGVGDLDEVVEMEGEIEGEIEAVVDTLGLVEDDGLGEGLV